MISGRSVDPDRLIGGVEVSVTEYDTARIDGFRAEAPASAAHALLRRNVDQSPGVRAVELPRDPDVVLAADPVKG